MAVHLTPVYPEGNFCAACRLAQRHYIALVCSVKCGVCDREVSNPHKICPECSEKNLHCMYCGEGLKNVDVTRLQTVLQTRLSRVDLMRHFMSDEAYNQHREEIIAEHRRLVGQSTA